jgi:hypothetical protein
VTDSNSYNGVVAERAVMEVLLMEQLRFKTFVAYTLPLSKDKFQYENEVDLPEADW